MIPLTDFNAALDLVGKATHDPGTEVVDLANAQGRVLAEDIVADRDYPPFNRSAMDGCAFATSAFDPELTYEIVDQIFAGQTSKVTSLESGQCVKIMTGAAVPDFADAVVPRELITPKGDGVAVEMAVLQPWLNIARQGEDAPKGQVVIQSGRRLNSGDLTAAASCGYSRVKVQKQLTVAIINTGDEIVEADQLPGPFQIRNSNQYALEGACRELGLKVIQVILVKDIQSELEKAVARALEKADILLTTGGVSAGDADFMPTVFTANGVGKVFHKVAMKPGKPLWFGLSKAGKPVFGLPGNPMSALLACHAFVGKYLQHKGYMADWSKISVNQDIRSHHKLTLLRPVTRTPTGYQIKTNNGSGDITGLVGVDGFVVIPQNQDVPAGQPVAFVSFCA